MFMNDRTTTKTAGFIYQKFCFMQHYIMAMAIPVFVLFISLEYFVARKKGLHYFNEHETVANLSIGIAERLLDVFTAGLFFYLYDHLQKHYGLFSIHPGLPMWLLLLVATDFIWYWYHRLAHEINLFWSVHIVHHQSEDFNYSVSARITIFQAFVRTAFWSVLPVIGFPAGMITSILLVHGLYPFFIHTRLVGKLGILEYILVTPSHHRVHHASNEKYLDRNYGDVFIIWDKLFGTFQKEEDEEPIVYGLTQPLKSYSFLWQHVHFLVELFYDANAKPGWREKLRVLFGRPRSVQPVAREKAERLCSIRHSNRPMGKPLNRYVLWQLGATITALFLFILFSDRNSLLQQVLISCLLLVTLVNCGAIMEQKSWISYLECSRLALAACSLLILSPSLWLLLVLLFLAALIFYYYPFLQVYYLKRVYASTVP